MNWNKDLKVKVFNKCKQKKLFEIWENKLIQKGARSNHQDHKKQSNKLSFPLERRKN